LIEEQIPVNRNERKKVVKVVRVEEIGNIRALEIIEMTSEMINRVV
jgi:hypothetical protein